MTLEDFKENVAGEIRFSVGAERYRLKFERYYLSKQIERIKVFGKEKELLLQSDRPGLLIGNKKKSVKWKIISPIIPTIYEHPDFVSILMTKLEDLLNDIDAYSGPASTAEGRLSYLQKKR